MLVFGEILECRVSLAVGGDTCWLERHFQGSLQGCMSGTDVFVTLSKHSKDFVSITATYPK